jgi:two-component system response regulator
VKPATKNKILIVDDSEDEVYLTRRAISKVAPEVTSEIALDGTAALELLRKAGDLPSLILLDLHLPRMSGLEVLREIRSDSRLRHLAVVLLSASGYQPKDAPEAGADGFLLKHCNSDEFRKNLAAILNERLK